MANNDVKINKNAKKLGTMLQWWEQPPKNCSKNVKIQKNIAIITKN